MVTGDRFVLREYYSRTNAPELNCPFYAQFRLYKRREIFRLVQAAIAGRTARPLRILDLGCGDGSDTDHALCRLTGFWKDPEAGAGLEITFAEGDPALVELVRARVTDLRDVLPRFVGTVLQLDVSAALPFEDGAFDLVISSEVLEHLERPEDAIAEVHRVLAPGGRLIFTSDNEPTLLGMMKRAISKLTGRHVPGERERYLATGGTEPVQRVSIGGRVVSVFGHINTRTTLEWQRAMEAAGFAIVMHGEHDSIARHFGHYSPWKMVVFSLASAIAASAPAWLGRRMGSTTIFLLGKR